MTDQETDTMGPTAADLAPTDFSDFEHPTVAAWIEEATAGAAGEQERLTRWFSIVRDRVRYDPYELPTDAASYRASAVAELGRGYCVPKAVLFVAGCRAMGLPSRIGFADVRNHLQTERLRQRRFRRKHAGVLFAARER